MLLDWCLFHIASCFGGREGGIFASLSYCSLSCAANPYRDVVLLPAEPSTLLLPLLRIRSSSSSSPHPHLFPIFLFFTVAARTASLNGITYSPSRPQHRRPSWHRNVAFFFGIRSTRWLTASTDGGRGVDLSVLPQRLARRCC